MIAASVAQCIVGLMSRGKSARADTDRRAANVYHCLRPRDAVVLSSTSTLYIIFEENMLDHNKLSLRYKSTGKSMVAL